MSTWGPQARSGSISLLLRPSLIDGAPRMMRLYRYSPLSIRVGGVFTCVGVPETSVLVDCQGFACDELAVGLIQIGILLCNFAQSITRWIHQQPD